MSRPEGFRAEHLAHIGFEVGVLLKGLNGLVEVAGGALLFVVKPQTISQTILLLTQNELSEDPQDLVARLLVRLAQHLTTNAQLFAGVYLLSHGVIKVILIAAMLCRKLWAYPVSIVVFALFGVYQTYRYYLRPSAAMILLTLLDLVVIVLTWMEFRRLRRSMTCSGA